MDCSRELIDRIVFSIANNGADLAGLQERLTIIVGDYEVHRKEESLCVYTGGKNEYLLKKFLLAKAVSGRSDGTIRAYRGTIWKVLTDIGKDADTITSFDMQVYLATIMTTGVSRSYCDTVRRYMSTFYTYLAKERLVSDNPMDRVDNIKFRREKEHAFSDMDVEKMRASCKNYFEKAMLEMLLSTGCRASELVSIKYEDIRDGQVEIVGKGNKVRTVYINAKASVAVLQYLAERNDDNPYLFPGMVRLTSIKAMDKRAWYKNPDLVGTGHYDRESVNVLMKRIGDRCGVQGVHAHRFRRTCATNALRRGMPIEYVSMMLGHEQIGTTQIYLDISEKGLKDAHEKYVM